MTSQERTIFLWLSGQEDNIGDSVLRRGYADALRPYGTLHVQTGTPSQSFVSGLGLRDDEPRYAGFAPWLLRLLAATLRGNTVIALNAGEFSMTKRYMAYLVLLQPVFALARLRKVPVIWLGSAVPSPVRGFTWLFRSVAKRAELLRWRDSGTDKVLIPAPWMPDWAFATGQQGELSSSADRTNLMVSLRFDRPYPSQEWVDEVKAFAAQHSLDIVTAAQVERDSPRAGQLAEQLGGRAVLWTAADHAGQEAIVRAEYAQARIMISDRLHGMIMAMTEGTTPLAWTENATTKMSRHFSALGMPWAVAPAATSLSELKGASAGDLDDYGVATLAALRNARAELAKLDAEINTRLTR